MKFESAVTSISWIPSEALTGLVRLPVDAGIGHYDDPPPDRIDDLDALRDAGRFRFANDLRAWIEVEGGAIVAAGYSGKGHICSTELSLGLGRISVPPVALPDIQREPVITGDAATFTQTTGGRTGAPLPRRVSRPPFVRLVAPIVWTTLELTLRADGTSHWRVVGASQMPRHWVYDANGELAAKSGTIDFAAWTRQESPDQTPWGDTDSPALITEVETALERQLSLQIMRGGRKPKIRTLEAGRDLTTQGEPGDELYLLLDGVLDVVVDGQALAQIGPGTLLGERALLEGGVRTSTLRAATPVKVAVADAASIDTAALETLASGRRREEARPAPDGG